MTQIELRDISLHYFTPKEETKALQHINLSIKWESSSALLVLVGAGKAPCFPSFRG